MWGRIGRLLDVYYVTFHENFTYDDDTNYECLSKHGGIENHKHK